MTTKIKQTLNNIIGSICVAFGFLCFSTNDMIVKWSKVKVMQLLFARYCVQFIIAGIWWKLKKPTGKYVNNWYGDSPYIKNVFIRGILYNSFMICFWVSCKLLPVGDVVAIVCQSAIVTTLLGKIFLKDKLPRLFIVIAIFNIFGSLLISQPTFLLNLFDGHGEPLNKYGLISINISIILWSLTCVLTKSAKESHFLQLELVSSSQMIFFIVPIILLADNYLFGIQLLGTFSTLKFDLFSIMTISVTGLVGFTSMSLCVIGYQLGDTTKVSWLEYITIVSSCLYQTFFFNDPLNQFELIGIILVVTACFVNLCEQYYDYYKAKKAEQYSGDEDDDIHNVDEDQNIPLIEAHSDTGSEEKFMSI